MNKALTVKNPWAWAIIHAGKDVENRSRPTSHRGRLYIHAGKGWSQEGLDEIVKRGLILGIDNPGMVIGTVDLMDCHHCDDCPGPDYAPNGACSEWAMPNQYHWVLANPRPLACPFPESGKLGLWNLGDMP